MKNEGSSDTQGTRRAEKWGIQRPGRFGRVPPQTVLRSDAMEHAGGVLQPLRRADQRARVRTVPREVWEDER